MIHKSPGGSSLSLNSIEIVATLAEIADAFKAHKPKSTSKNVHYPKALRQFAVSALSKKITAAEIARAAGVAPKSIRNWRDAIPKVIQTQLMPKARRLKVIPLRPQTAFEHCSVAQIKLPSGVVIEMAPSELSTDLLCRLCGLENLR